MVYIKMANQSWILSGLQKLINKSCIIMISTDRYIPYKDFKIASTLTSQPIHSLIHRQHIISNIKMKQIIKQSELTPAQRHTRQQLKLKHELRLINRYNTNSNSYYFQQKKDQSIKDISQSISFGMTFIFSFFMAGLTGYYFGVYFLGFELTKALMVAVGFIMATIVLQTGLYVIKQDRDDKRKAFSANQKYKQQFQRKPTAHKAQLLKSATQNKKQKLQ